MSRPHIHSSTAETQNQGNSLGERACIRQSKLFRTHESGNTMKGLLGCNNLAWKTDVTEGAYAGRSTYDHNNPYPPPQQSKSSSYRSQESVRDAPLRHSQERERERSYAYEYGREPQSTYQPTYQSRERSYEHRDSPYEHESTHQSTAISHRNTRINSNSSTGTMTTNPGTTRAIDDPRLRALAEQRVLAAVAASQVIAMGPHGYHSSANQSIPRHKQRQHSSDDYATITTNTTSTNRDHRDHRDYSRTSYNPTQTSTTTSTRPW